VPEGPLKDEGDRGNLKEERKIMRLRNQPTGIRRSAGAAGLTALALLAAGCAGSAGSATASGGGTDAGYEFGASDEEIKAAFADVDPITLTFQPAAQSPNEVSSQRELTFVETVEELSGGKITFDVVWGQAVAPFEELPDALVDGRVDVANLPIVYYPNEFPKYNAMVTTTTQLGGTPLVGELAATAAMSELWWNSPEVLEELEEHSVHPILPIEPTGQQAAVCKSELTETSDWDGALVRGSSASQMAQIEGMGASPTTMTISEVFEALQRNTIECSLFPYLGISLTGIAETAPHINYPTEVSIARGPSTIAIGSVYDSLPLAAKQLLFDTAGRQYQDSRYADFQSLADSASQVRDAGGGFHEMSAEVQTDLSEASTALIQKQVEDGLVPEDAPGALNDSYEKWFAVAEELGYTDDGGMGDFDKWFDADSVDLAPFSERVYEELFLPHRPAAG
jgi:TRAP-type C4-dicarboxylate transport system substrate-binding protein